MAEDIMAEDLSHRMWQSQAGTVLEVSFLLASFHSAGRFDACYYRRKVIINHAYNKDWPAMTCPLLQQWHKHQVSKQPLSGWISVLLHKIKPIPSIISKLRTYS